MARSLFAFLLFISFLGATPVAAIIMRHDKDSAAYERLAETYGHALVWIRFRDSEGLVVSEGTLIGERWVLTAAHVAENMTPGATVDYGGETFKVERTYSHPDWTGNVEELHDLALLKLATSVINPKPAGLYRRNDEEGKEIVVVGRGMSGSGLTGPEVDDQVVRAATNRIAVVGPKHISFAFDSPKSKSATALEGISGPGDSGGPALLIEEGKLYVIGISSAQDDAPTQGREGRYGVLEYYTRVSAFVDWIDKTIEKNTADNP